MSEVQATTELRPDEVLYIPKRKRLTHGRFKGEDGNEVYKDFAPSLTVTTTIMNNRFPGLLTTDAGTKALTLNKPNPGVIGEPGMDYTAGSDEFGSIKVTSASKAYKIGDKLELIVPHCDPVVNEYDQIYGIRKDRVEAVWPITARGKSQ